MMNQQQDQHQQSNPINNLYEMGIELVYFIGSVFSTPVEFWLRPNFGTRYVHPVTQFFSFVVMVFFSGVIGLLVSFGAMIPFHRYQPPPPGLVNFNMFFLAYFLTGVYHNFRTWILMVHPEREKLSRFENSALPPFRLLPKGDRFHFVRIVWEPAAVFIASILLAHFFLIDQYVALYLKLAAVMLFAKNSVRWYRAWEHLRNAMDQVNSGPIIAKVVEGTATEDETASVQLSRFPASVNPPIKTAAAADVTGLPPEIERLISPVEKQSA